MARWQPGAGDRLQQAALDLFVEQGYERTTVGQIAARAGVTTRTFFRYFADKREVLFGGGEELPAIVTRAVLEAPSELSALEVVDVVLQEFCRTVAVRPKEFIRTRRAVIAGDPRLQERELRKLADLGDALAHGLRARGADAVQATLAAEIAVAVFKVALQRWLGAADDPPPEADAPDLSALAGDTLRRLREMS